MVEEERRRLAEAVRRACVAAALEAWEEAGAAGICAEGRWEAAVGALRSLDVAVVASDAGSDDAGAGDGER